MASVVSADSLVARVARVSVPVLAEFAVQDWYPYLPLFLGSSQVATKINTLGWNIREDESARERRHQFTLNRAPSSSHLSTIFGNFPGSATLERETD